MKKALVLLVALFICGVAFSQENEKKFTLSIQENLLPFADEGEGRYLTIACDKVRRQIQFAVDFLYLHR
jgi:hypothetical protein